MKSRSMSFSNTIRKKPNTARGTLRGRLQPQTTDLVMSAQRGIANQLIQNEVCGDSPIVRRLAQANEVLEAAGKGSPTETKNIKSSLGDATEQAISTAPPGWKTDDQVAKRFILNVAARMVAEFASDKMRHLQPIAEEFLEKLMEAYL